MLLDDISASNLFAEIIKKFEDYQEYQIHKCISNGQRDKYRNQINDINLLDEYTIIDFDFKQKIVKSTT